MSKQASSIAVGSFVIGAIVLIVAGVLLFGSGKFFTQTHTAVAVFPGNVKGLKVGAAVEFRGVRIGSVKNIKVLMDRSKNKVYVPVYFDIERGVIEDMDFGELAENLSDKEWREEVEKLIEAGLKAQLVLQSVVTGQSIIDR
jgi:phospholipid/cholesterol/gamma-HCH transport system substrate-binding protein